MVACWSWFLGLRQRLWPAPVVLPEPVKKAPGPGEVWLRFEFTPGGGGGRQVFVNDVEWPPISFRADYDGLSTIPATGEPIIVKRSELAAWYIQLAWFHPEDFSHYWLKFLQNHLGWSETLGIVMEMLPPVPQDLEGLLLAEDHEVWAYFNRLREISVKRLFSRTERTFKFTVPEWCKGRPIPRLFDEMPHALEAISQVEAWGPDCWEEAARLTHETWYPNATYIGPAAYEKVLYGLPVTGIWYPEPDFAARLSTEIDELEKETLRRLKKVRDQRRQCVERFKAVVRSANDSAREKRGATVRLRNDLRDAGLYCPDYQ